MEKGDYLTPKASNIAWCTSTPICASAFSKSLEAPSLEVYMSKPALAAYRIQHVHNSKIA